MLELLWKLIEVIIDTKMQRLKYYDCLHGFLAGHGTGTRTLQVKLAQLLAYLEQVTLYDIFVNLRKAYDVMDRGQCL